MIGVWCQHNQCKGAKLLLVSRTSNSQKLLALLKCCWSRASGPVRSSTTVLDTDPSDVGVGCVLYQEQDGKEYYCLLFEEAESGPGPLQCYSERAPGRRGFCSPIKALLALLG